MARRARSHADVRLKRFATIPFLASERTFRFSSRSWSIPGSSAAMSIRVFSTPKAKGCALAVRRKFHETQWNRRRASQLRGETCLAEAAEPRRRIRGRRCGVFVVETLGNGVVAITRDGIQDP